MAVVPPNVSEREEGEEVSPDTFVSASEETVDIPVLKSAGIVSALTVFSYTEPLYHTISPT